jgi:hypothetical protein
MVCGRYSAGNAGRSFMSALKICILPSGREEGVTPAIPARRASFSLPAIARVRANAGSETRPTKEGELKAQPNSPSSLTKFLSNARSPLF